MVLKKNKLFIHILKNGHHDHFGVIEINHKSKDYKLSILDYYLIEDESQENVCKIFKCSA